MIKKFLRKQMKYSKNVYKKTRDTIRDFSSDPLNNCGFLIPVALV